MKGRYLVTGAAGFVGANITAALVARGAAVVAADDFSEGDWRNLRALDVEVWQARADAPELLEMIAGGAFDAVFHEAAITDTTVADAAAMIEANTNAFRRILDAAVTGGVRLVYASSAGVYGNTPAPNRVGEGELPENVYGFSKLAMDRIARARAAHARAPVVGLRYFNVYGPGEEHKFTRAGVKTASMVRQLYEQAKAGGPMRLFEWGGQKRDFVYVRDVVAANLAALRAPASGVANVGTGRARTFNELARAIMQALGREVPVEYFPNPYPFYQNHTEADLAAGRRLLPGWEPRWPLEEGVAEYVRLLEDGHHGPAPWEAA